MSFKWKDQQTPLFLEAYKRNECLWNKKSRDYNRLNVREKAYSLMLKELNLPGLTVTDIRTKINSIRTQHGREFAKIKRSEINAANAEDVYEPRLFWFKQADAFLHDVCTYKPNFSNIKMEESDTNDTTVKIKYIDETEEYTTDGQCWMTEDNESITPENLPSPTTPKIDANIQDNGENVRKRSATTSVSELHDVIKRIVDQNESNETPNEFDLFCKSLAIQLKNMPLDRALICQVNLQNVMTEERLSQLM